MRLFLVLLCLLPSLARAEWRRVDPENTIYMELPGGRVIIELAPAFAPNHVANIKALAREKFFDALTITRAQDNYVVQWGDEKRPVQKAKRALPPEFAHPEKGVPFTPLPDRDVYAAETGHSDGFPAARDAAQNLAWLTHCYAMVGVGRDDAPDSGGGTELYVVIGHAPRHLDRNVTLVGRVLKGIELLSILPRGTGQMGFYEKNQHKLPIKSVRVAADVPEKERTPLEVLRTDGPEWTKHVESKRTRKEKWFQFPAGRIDVCNVPIPVRAAPGI